MSAGAKRKIRIDLNQFKLHLLLKPEVELTLHFDSPSRRFYLSVIALVVHEMKKRGRIASIPIEKHLEVLALLNETIGAAAGSSNREHLLPRIYRKWKDALPDLENAPLFKVVGRKKRYTDTVDKVYAFGEEERDRWANLFDYSGSHARVRLRFSVDRLDASLDDVILVYGKDEQGTDIEAWGKFVTDLKAKQTPGLLPRQRNGDAGQPAPSEMHSRNGGQRILSRWQVPALVILSALLATALISVLWRANPVPHMEVASESNMAFPLPNRPSLVVLPFRNLSDDPGEAYFSDGLTEEIITVLSKVPELFVIAPNSSFAYQGKAVGVRQISEELGVRYVLDGSVRKDAKRVRITARLIDVLRGQVIWSDQFHRKLEDIFVIQDDITFKILTALQIRLLAGDEARLLENQTDNLQAYLKMLEGSAYNQKSNFASSARCFKAARTLDPQFAEAYAREALAYLADFLFGPSTDRWPQFVKAFHTANRCTEIDADHAACLMAVGFCHIINRDYFSAVLACQQAVKRWPNSAEAAVSLARALHFSGRFEEALGELERALRLDPIRPVHALATQGYIYYNMGQNGAAIGPCKRAVQLFPHHLLAYMTLALAYASEGRVEEARGTIAAIMGIRPNLSLMDFRWVFPKKPHQEIEAIIGDLLPPGPQD